MFINIMPYLRNCREYSTMIDKLNLLNRLHNGKADTLAL